MKLHITFLSLLLSVTSLYAKDQKPNIIYVIADDLGYGDLSCYGQKNFETPHLDAMAKQGIRFTSHYSGSTVCAPSRSALMTGQDTGHTYIRGNGQFQLRKSDTTIAHLLKSAGYSTGMVGKSCVTGNTKDPQAPHLSGFDYFYGTLSHVTAHHHYPTHVFSQGKKLKLEGNNVKTGKQYIQDVYTDQALKFIDKNQKKPFFLLLSYSVPHADLSVPQDSVEPFLKKFKNDKVYKGAHYAACPHVKATYAGMVTRLDSYMGMLNAKLKKLGIEENTIICFTSDNGSHFEGGYHKDLLQSNGILRGGKRDLYEGGIRVPFIVKWPSKITPNRTSDHPSAFWDFLPTACDIAQVKLPSQTKIQGVSYLPELLGKEQPKHSYLYWEFHEAGGRVALRQGKWKLVKYHTKKRKENAAESNYQLYDLSKDISEKNNLAAQRPEVLKRLIKLCESHRVKSPVKPWN